MAAQDAHGYQVVDTLYLWWTGDPARPVLIGEPGLVRTLRGVSLRSAESWRSAGFPLSEDLPLIDAEFLPTDKATAATGVLSAGIESLAQQVDRSFLAELRRAWRGAG